VGHSVFYPCATVVGQGRIYGVKLFRMCVATKANANYEQETTHILYSPSPMIFILQMCIKLLYTYLYYPRTAMAKAAFSKKKTLFTRKLDLNLRKKLIKCYIWSMALYGAETWTLRAADQKYLEIRNTWKVSKCGAGGGWRISVGPIT